ncbi:MAG TPA: O-antigen ligase family protein, partial [Solirubrobacteraceae bacterium]|nr:O-antigen ligase family protein [Solirubrobacteraceae bacterium]
MSSRPAPLERPVDGPGEAVGPRVRRPRLPPAPALAGTLPQPNALLTAGIGLLLAALAIGGGGTASLRSATIAHLAMVLAGGGLVAGAGLIAARPRRLWGVWSMVGLVVLAALTATSIAWSINPADSWLEANRTFAYAAVFAAVIAGAHVAPHRWQALLGGVLVGCVVASVYALATKVLPGLLAENEIYARLRQPFGYWNAVGLMAALGLPACLWLGSRRHGHAGINALAYPAAGLLSLTLLLSYSRGALLAGAVGCALWFALVPRRLRGFAVLGTGVVVAFAAALWAFGQAALTEDEVDLALRAAAGAHLGLLAAAVALTLLVAGLALGFTTALRPPPPLTRRRAGAIALVAVALVPVGVTVALAASERGLGGSLAAGWDSVTAPEVANPTNGPSRLTDPQSVRGLYWRESLQMFADNPVAGLGAGGFETARPRYGPDLITTSYAHGFGFQTLADLGLAGGLVVAALFAAWAAAALRASGLSRGWRRRAHTPERMGLITLLAVAVVFGVHSLIDWTWVFPATAAAALLCAGWLAGRGPFDEPPRARAERRMGRLRPRLGEGLR